MSLDDRRKLIVQLHLELAFAESVRAVESGWIDQEFSPLGYLPHCTAVRRRVDSCAGGAVVIGRRHLLHVDALAEEYFAAGLRLVPSGVGQ